MTTKRIKIELGDKNAFGDYYYNSDIKLYTWDVPNLVSKRPKEISEEELSEAFNIIINRMIETGENMYILDLDQMDKAQARAKEMTIEEIEAQLGHKIKIVGESESGSNKKFKRSCKAIR